MPGSVTEEERDGLRASVLRDLGAEPEQMQELLKYNANVFERRPELEDAGFPLPDEPFVEAWEGYIAAAKLDDARLVLHRPLIQLNFPIRSGISQEDGYRKVTLRGHPPGTCPAATGLALNCPGDIRVRLHPTPAGRIPVLLVRDREDFENLIRALTCRNEPQPVPASQGAAMVAGYNNWDRIEQYRREWLDSHPATEWPAEFKRLIPQKERYQDRFIVVSEGPYSGVAAQALGLTDGRS